MSLKLSQKAYLLISVPLVFEIIFVCALIGVEDQLNRSHLKEEKLREVLILVNQQMRKLPEAGISLGLYGLTSERKHLLQSRQSISEVSQDKEKLSLLCSPEEQPLVAKFNSCIDSILHKLNDSEARVQSNDRFELLSNLRSVQLLVKRSGVAAMELAERQRGAIAKQQSDAEKLKNTINALVVGGVTISILLSGLMAYVFYAQIMSKVDHLMLNTTLLSKGKRLQNPLVGNDELTELDHTFHKMADSLKSLQRKQLAVLDNAAEMICSVSPKGRIESINKAALSVLGYEPDELINAFFSVIVAENQKTVHEQLMSAVNSEEVHSFEMTARKKDGSSCTLYWVSIWNTEEQQLFCVAHDVTKQKKIEHFRREMIAMVSHDLRGPMTSLQICFELFEGGAFGDLNESGRRKAAQSTRVIKRLTNLIEGLLNIEKIQSGELTIEPSRARFEDLVERAIDAVQNLADRKKLAIKLELEPQVVECDEVKVTEVIINFLHNAIKFSPGGSNLLVKTITAAPIIELMVCDQGKGVPLDKRELIFERFKQSDPQGETESQGTGLGLAIAKSIITAHGGTIGVRSDSTWSSIFWFKLPLSQGDLPKV